jgi:hypothetical protein
MLMLILRAAQHWYHYHNEAIPPLQKLAVAQKVRSSNAPDLYSGDTGFKSGFADWLQCLVFSSISSVPPQNAKTVVNITSRLFLAIPFRIHNSLIALSVESVTYQKGQHCYVSHKLIKLISRQFLCQWADIGAHFHFVLTTAILKFRWSA